MRDAFESWNGRGQFAGHETFPLRLLWLKKAFDAVEAGAPSTIFSEPEAIVRFGVGRNMAVAMRYWAVAAGMVEEVDKRLHPTKLGRALLADGGWDPFLEHPSTLWLVHWKLASDPTLTTTIYFAFNAIAAPEFDAAGLVSDLECVVARQGWRAGPVTIKRDVEVFLRSYVRRSDVSIEDAAEPLLAELNLVRDVTPAGYFEFVRGPKPSLSAELFAYALADFWHGRGEVSTLSAEQICYAPGSPGRVFKLDEDSVVTHLMHMDAVTGGAWLWTDTAGLKQVQRKRNLDPQALLAAAYALQKRRAA